MKHLLWVTLFLIVFRNNFTNAQCISPTSFNGSLNFSSSVTSIPNDMAPTGWSKTNTPDQAKAGIPIDCTNLPLVASSNGGSWTRMADKITAQEAIYRNISGFTSGTYYEVSFQQSLVKNWARSSGNVKVTIGSTSIYSTTIALPAASVAQTNWQNVTVGPFLATATTMTVSLEAHSNQDGTGSSPMPGSCSGYTQNALAADLMIDGITICPVTSLPLNFLTVDLTAQPSYTQLSWTISDTENELEKFIISASNTMQDWIEVGEVNGNPSTSSYVLSIPISHTNQTTYYKISAYNKNKELIALSTILSDKTMSNNKPCGWKFDQDTETLTTSAQEEIKAALYDLKGTMIFAYSSNEETPSVSVNHLPKGLYILFTYTSTENCSFRFVK